MGDQECLCGKRTGLSFTLALIMSSVLSGIRESKCLVFSILKLYLHTSYLDKQEYRVILCLRFLPGTEACCWLWLGALALRVHRRSPSLLPVTSGPLPQCQYHQDQSSAVAKPGDISVLTYNRHTIHKFPHIMYQSSSHRDDCLSL